MKVFYLILSHVLAFCLGWRCNDMIFHYLAEKIDFDEAAKRLMEMDGDDE